MKKCTEKLRDNQVGDLYEGKKILSISRANPKKPIVIHNSPQKMEQDFNEFNSPCHCSLFFCGNTKQHFSIQFAMFVGELNQWIL